MLSLFQARLRKVSGNKPVVTVSATSAAKALKSGAASQSSSKPKASEEASEGNVINGLTLTTSPISSSIGETKYPSVKRGSISSVENEPEGGAAAQGQQQTPGAGGKRKSTGSISSLRKMWESTGGGEGGSPALGGRKAKEEDGTESPATTPMGEKSMVMRTHA